MTAETELFDELSCYTLSHPGPEFVHQYIVDAFGVQRPRSTDKPIRLIFGLVGLYLYVERGFTGREVQQVHMRLGQERRQRRLPGPFALPPVGERGSIRVAAVLAATPGPARDRMIGEWCAAVWAACGDCREAIVGYLNGVVPAPRVG